MSAVTIGRQIEADPTGSLICTSHPSWRAVYYGEEGIVSEDPTLGPYLIPNDKVGRILNALARTSAFRRSYDLGQLSDLPDEGTIPNSPLFSTAGGNLGQLPFITFVNRALDGNSTSLLAYITAQAITDVSHGPLRHITDMEFEGLSGSQTFHDARKGVVYSHGGIQDIFDNHDILLDEGGLLRGVEIPPAIESSKPHINADNFQYVLNEAYEWFAGYEGRADVDATTARQCQEIIDRIKGFRNFGGMIEIVDGHIVFKRPEDALFFQKCQMIISTEDWKDPINRVMEHFYIQDLMYMKVNRLLPDMDEIDHGTTKHPICYTYYVDSDIAAAYDANKDDPYLNISRQLKVQMGREERERFVKFKLRHYARFLTDEASTDYPNESLNGGGIAFGHPSSRVDILKSEDVPPNTKIVNSAARLAAKKLQSREGVTYVLDPLKNRVVQPFVRDCQGNVVFLDELDSKIGKASKVLLAQHQSLQWKQLTVRLVTTRGYTDILRDTFRTTAAAYDELCGRSRHMTADQIRRSIGRAASVAEHTALGSGLLVIAK